MRRSTIHTSELSSRHAYLSPYRCRDCGERFWVVSRKAYYVAGMVGTALVVAAVMWGLGATSRQRDHAVDEGAQHAGRLADLVKLANKGDATAEYELATLYTTGAGVPRSDTEAFKWMERAAVHGNAAAQYELGIALRDGRGALQDFRGAMKWIGLAADAGDGKAQFALGMLYRQGTGTPVDNVRAYVWLNLAAAQGVGGAAAARDAVRTQLTPAEIDRAQAEARRLGEAPRRRPTSP